MSGFYTPARYRSSSHVKRKLRSPQKRSCQRCGRSFKATRDVPYCGPCFREKKQERHAAYVQRVASRALGNRPGIERAED